MNEPQDFENKMKGIFGSLNRDAIAPHPFLKTRILADSKALIEAQKKVFFWKILSSLTMASLVVSLYFNQSQPGQKVIAMNEPYVIHMKFSDAEARHIAMAEIILPEDVSFHSLRNPQLSERRTLRLPVTARADGRTKLPFVVMAKHAGQKEIQVRLFDHDNKVIKDDVISVKFNGRG